MAKIWLKLNRAILITVIIAVAVLLFSSKSLAADQELKIFFSGILKDSEGELAQSGDYNMQFGIYSSPTSSVAMWNEIFSEEDKISVIKGRFQIVLGNKTVLDFELDAQKYWLGTIIGGKEDAAVWDEEMKPRIPIVTLESLFLEGRVEVSQEDFVKVLIEEFKKSATSTESITQRAFLEFLQTRLIGSEAQAVIISPQTLNILFEGILNFEGDMGDGAPDGLWATLLQFFRDILNTISQSLAQLFEQVSQILLKLTDIEGKQDEIIALLGGEEGTETGEGIEGEIVEEDGLEQGSELESKIGPNFLVEDFGETTIAKGETMVKVYTEYLTQGARIFVTLKSPISGIWWISDKKTGEYFEISILTPPEEDLELDYWIVTPKEEILTIPLFSPLIEISTLEETEEEPDMRELIEQRQAELRGETGASTNVPEDEIPEEVVQEEIKVLEIPLEEVEGTEIIEEETTEETIEETAETDEVEIEEEPELVPSATTTETE